MVTRSGKNYSAKRIRKPANMENIQNIANSTTSTDRTPPGGSLPPGRRTPAVLVPGDPNSNLSTGSRHSNGTAGRYPLPKPVTPSQLCSISNIREVKEFVRRFEQLRDRYGDEQVKVEDYIGEPLWPEKEKQYPEVFRPGNNQGVLHWLRDQIYQEEKYLRENPWKYIHKIKFEPVKKRNLYRSVKLFLGKVNAIMGYAESPKVKKMLLKRAVLHLPASYSIAWIGYATDKSPAWKDCKEK